MPNKSKFYKRTIRIIKGFILALITGIFAGIFTTFFINIPIISIRESTNKSIDEGEKTEMIFLIENKGNSSATLFGTNILIGIDGWDDQDFKFIDNIDRHFEEIKPGGGITKRISFNNNDIPNPNGDDIIILLRNDFRDTSKIREFINKYLLPGNPYESYYWYQIIRGEKNLYMIDQDQKSKYEDALLGKFNERF